MPTQLSRYYKPLAWILRIESVVVLVICLADIAHHGWSWEVTVDRGPKGILAAAMLFAMSFVFGERTRKATVLAGLGTILFATLLLGCSLAGLFR